MAPGEAAGALEQMRTSDVTGLSVTMPHKADVAALVDECSDVARRLNAVNCVHQQEGGFLYGTNTDGDGFVASLARGAAFEPAGKRCVVVGAGGAARAVVLALAKAGASHVAVVNRTAERAFEAAALAGDHGTVVPLTEHAIADAVGVADLVVNATPVGMTGVAGGPVEWLVAPDLLGEGQVAADLVYVPRQTRLARAGGGRRRDDPGRPGHARPPGRGAAGGLDRRGPSDRGHVAEGRGGGSLLGARISRRTARTAPTARPPPPGQPATDPPWPARRASPRAAPG